MKNYLENSLCGLYKKVESIKHPLKILCWESTLKCNLNCLHCGSNCSPSIKDQELSSYDIKCLLLDISKNYNAQNIMFYITGGEPLLRNDIFEIGEYAHSLGYKWGIVTNATLVTEETVKCFNETYLHSLSISVDGLKEQHDHIRGKGSFDKSIEGIFHFLKHTQTIKSFDITTCINKLNINYLEDMYQFFKTLDIDFWRPTATSPIGRAQNSDILLDANDYKILYDFIKEKRISASPIVVTACDEGFLGREYELQVRNHRFYCAAGINIASILSNGDIFGCPSIPRHFPQGNIKTDNFVDVWENKFKPFRNRNWMNQGKCKKCSYFNTCQGNSMHLWDFEKNETKLCHIDLLQKANSSYINS